jgi:hypothetical protein
MRARANKKNIQTVKTDSPDSMAEQHISVSEELKLVTKFSGNKMEVLTFISNVNTAFEVIKPNHKYRLYESVLTRISGEERTATSRLYLDSWAELRELFRSTYIEKRTLYFHANQLFKASRGKSDSVSQWIQKIRTLGSKFREAALTDCSDEERAGILTLSEISVLCEGYIQIEYRPLSSAEITTISTK